MMVKTEMIRFGENGLFAIGTEMIYCSLGGNNTVWLHVMSEMCKAEKEILRLGQK
jgi:hypothetical protein